MGNCLVTKLKGIVNNPDIPFMNEFRIEFKQLANPQTGSHQLYIDLVGTCEIKVVKGSGTFTINGGSPLNYYKVTDSGGFTLEGSNSDFAVIITDKYKIYSISCDLVDNWAIIEKGWGMDLSQLNFCNIWAILALRGNKNTSMLRCYKDDAHKAAIESINISTPVDVDTFTYNGNQATTITRFAAYNANSVGSILSLSNYISLTTMGFSSPNVKGDIDSFCAAMVAAGRTSGNLIFELSGSGCTDEGNLITEEYIISKGGSYAIRATFDASTPNGYTKSYI